MKYIVHKGYWDYEKEEKWLNEMSAKGMALTDYSWCRYVFTEAPENEYTYRIELLKHRVTHPESIAYIRFLEENGVECVATYMHWIYLRKKSSEGEFDIYSDIESKIEHYKRVNVLWTTLMYIEFIVGLMNVAVGVIDHFISNGPTNGHFPNLLEGILLLALGILFLKLGLPIRKKIKRLQKENIIRE